MLPQILRLPEYGTPVAALTFDGLGICSFNNSLKAWEVAFIRDAEHELTVKVREVDHAGKIIRDMNRIPIDASRRLIKLSVDNGSVAHFTQFNKGFFRTPSASPSRLGDDNYDFRWVIDFIGREVLNGNFRTFNKQMAVTIVTVPNALFYTQRVTTDSVILAPEGTERPEDFPVFGRTNELIGAAIYARPPGMIKLEYAMPNGTPTGSVTEDPLPQVDGHIYEISFMNMDDEGRSRKVVGSYAEGDFHRLYNIIGVTGARKYSLFAPRRYHLLSEEGDCHMGGAGHDGGNLPSLMELIMP